ncbi:MAG: DUF5063 domain-containing protein [Clostridia bacterium]|nr:DUF5063 domain-containing protein [Clostridia bacterium]
MCSYYDAAREFCSWAETIDAITPYNAETVIIQLMRMYELSTHLVYPERCEEMDSTYEYSVLPFNVPYYDAYWEVFDPYSNEEDDPVCGSLKDDINSIYNDVREGIQLFDNGYRSEANWRWKFSFETHWKYHAVDAIRALNSLVSKS